MDIDQRRNAWAIIAFAAILLLILRARITGLVLVATLAYLLMNATLRGLQRHVPPRAAKPLALVAVVAVLSGIVYAVAVAIQGHVQPAGGVASLLDMLADTLERLRTTLPAWVGSKLPASLDDVQHGLAASLRSHAVGVQRLGHELARAAAHVFVGAIVGILAALEAPMASASPWLAAARRRGRNYVQAFSDILLAQLAIAAVNTLLTAAFLFVALPLADVRVPFSGMLVALTFVVGLLPIVGNLVSNAAILLAALTVSTTAALAALVFLLVVHKLEYVLNAQFVGHKTKVPAATLLGTMVLLEAFFGLAGLVLAPIACAWAFHEARDSGIL